MGGMAGGMANTGQAVSGMLGRGQQAPTQAQAPMGSATPQVTPNVYRPSMPSPQPMQMMSPAQQFQRAGLQALMANMMAQYQNVPGATAMPRQAPMQMPQYVNPALSYRPTMQPAQASLGRVAKSVILQQKEAAEAELARMKAAEEDRLAQERSRQSYDSGGAG